eukprot:TRINITY_DN6252_c0_g1_i2.p1 TRINITY_DN6252_c0_g1~~TRINITY_DN6252_c0_g1_i2.p1  ORF type:complete len:1327 (-),score=433.29 TRINITY_DN6252_c0_g1_i2:12-3866(-)
MEQERNESQAPERPKVKTPRKSKTPKSTFVDQNSGSADQPDPHSERKPQAKQQRPRRNSLPVDVNSSTGAHLQYRPKQSAHVDESGTATPDAEPIQKVQKPRKPKTPKPKVAQDGDTADEQANPRPKPKPKPKKAQTPKNQGDHEVDLTPSKPAKAKKPKQKNHDPNDATSYATPPRNFESRFQSEAPRFHSAPQDRSRGGHAASYGTPQFGSNHYNNGGKQQKFSPGGWWSSPQSADNSGRGGYRGKHGNFGYHDGNQGHGYHGNYGQGQGNYGGHQGNSGHGYQGNYGGSSGGRGGFGGFNGQGRSPRHRDDMGMSQSYPPTFENAHTPGRESNQQWKRGQRNATPKSAKEANPKNSGRKSGKNRFEEHLSREDLLAGIKNGTLFKGAIRINAKKPSESYVTAPGFNQDILIETFIRRNRAFEGDIVVVEVFDKSKWKQVKSLDDDEVEETVAQELAEELFDPSDESDEDDVVDNSVIIDENLVDDPLNLEAEEGETEESGSEDEGESIDDSEEEDEEDVAESVAAMSLGTPERSQAAPQKSTPATSQALPQRDTPSSQIKLKQQDSQQSSKAEVPTMTDSNAPPTPAGASKKEELRPVGKVVGIYESKHSKRQVGTVGPFNEKEVKSSDRFAAFVPLDPKTPKMIIPIGQIPEFYKNPKSYENKLVLVEPNEWMANRFFPWAKFKGLLGEAGEIGPETEAILLQHEVDFRDFSKEILDTLPKDLWAIPPEEIAKRRDLRKVRIFTIDPPTAKDLDDALHCTPLPDGNFEVGVHIADVSFFVKPGTPLDKEAQSRATTVYLVQKAITMLPHLLCENLCSLNPGVDRLAFSVIWKMTPQGQILDEWFGRTVIRSCSKMPYDVAQYIIEGKMTKSFEEMDASKNFQNLGPVNGFSVPQIVQDVLNMQMIASSLRRQRFQDGSLAMNNMKLSFRLNDTGNPVSTYQYITKEANHLVEEFMLMANQQVAIKIANAFPDKALLRNHIAPLARKLEAFAKFCQKHTKFAFDASTAKSMGESLAKMKARFDPVLFTALQLMATRSMQLAKYFSTGAMPEDEWKHFALNMKYYTHFTSPIRRYPDIIVHRLLQAAIDSENATRSQLERINASLMSSDDLTELATHCNDKKLNSRKAQELSAQLFLCVLLKNNPVVVEAVALGLGDKYMSVLLPSFGFEKRLYMEDMPLNSFKFAEGLLSLQWTTHPVKQGDTFKKTSSSLEQKINVLDVFKVRVGTKVKKGRPDLDLWMLHPSEKDTPVSDIIAVKETIGSGRKDINTHAFVEEDASIVD